MQYLEQLLDDCTVSVLDAHFTHCWIDWAGRDYIPEYNKFYFIQSGDGELVVDGQIYHPQPGELFLMPAGVKQSYYAINDNCYVKYWCHFTAQSSGVRLFDAIRTPLCVRPENPERLTQNFRELVDSVEKPDEVSRLRGKAALLEILAAYLSAAGMEFSEGFPADQLTRLTAYITAHLSGEITLEDLAAIVHFHPNYFISFFKKYFGMPPLKYVAEARLEKAKRLLKATDESVAQVAEQTGFHDLYHFSKRFKAYTGFSPSDFRRL